jgi:alpha-galactosidase
MGINHFTWLDKVTYMGEDLIPLYKEAIEKNSSAFDCASDDNWINNVFATDHSVKRDLFKRYGIVAAAGDRHLAEFVPGKWYSVHSDIWNLNNWNVAKEDAVLPY